MVLLNRRGFARRVFCRAVRRLARVPALQHLARRCTRAARRARCHYCNYAAAAAARRARVRRRVSRAAGFGTERVEAEVQRAIPGRAGRARRSRHDAAARSDRRACCARFARGEIDVLVGTQMIAKGHDFPRVTLVGVVVGGRRARAGGLPRGRAHVPAAHPGGRPSRPRHAAAAKRSCRRSIRTTTASAAAPRRTTRRSTARDDVPPSDALSAGGRADQRRRAIGDAADRRDGRCDDHRQRAARRPPPRGARPGAGAARRGCRANTASQFFMKGSSAKAMRRALQRALDERPELARGRRSTSIRSAMCDGRRGAGLRAAAEVSVDKNGSIGTGVKQDEDHDRDHRDGMRPGSSGTSRRRPRVTQADEATNSITTMIIAIASQL